MNVVCILSLQYVQLSWQLPTRLTDAVHLLAFLLLLRSQKCSTSLALWLPCFARVPNSQSSPCLFKVSPQYHILPSVGWLRDTVGRNRISPCPVASFALLRDSGSPVVNSTNPHSNRGSYLLSPVCSKYHRRNRISLPGSECCRVVPRRQATTITMYIFVELQWGTSECLPRSKLLLCFGVAGWFPYRDCTPFGDLRKSLKRSCGAAPIGMGSQLAAPHTAPSPNTYFTRPPTYLISTFSQIYCKKRNLEIEEVSVRASHHYNCTHC